MKQKISPLILVLTFIFVLSSCSTRPVSQEPQKRGVAFVAKRATEATLTFGHQVEIITNKKPTMEEARTQVEEQVLHLFGPMERATSSAAPKEDHEITITDRQPAKEREDVWVISYEYFGTIVVEKGPTKFLDLVLPINPDTIYDIAKGNRKTNPCTDDHYNEVGDFWYFWSPAKKDYENCNLERGVDYNVVKGNIERHPAPRTTYPDYPRLVKNDSIDVHLLFGMDDPEKSHNPTRSKDLAAESFRRTKKDLIELGFSIEPWQQEDIKKLARLKGSDVVPVVEDAIKEFPARGITMRVRLFFGESGIDENSKAFHFFLKDALEKSAIMIYDGHSGLGSNLDLKKIAQERKFRFEMDKNRYQIFFFNSCTSFTYYNTLYFQRKRKNNGRAIDPKGTKNLDILANGLSTAFELEVNTDLSLIRAVNQWLTGGQWTSYRRLAQELDSDNLFTVNGDEDNPKEPVR